MRTLPVLAVPVLLVACSSEPTGFDHQAQLERPVRGVVLHDDGTTGHAGMFGTNCPFETVQGTVTGDYALPGEGEEVQDGGDLIGEDTVLLVLGDDGHLLDKSTGAYSHASLRVRGVTATRRWERTKASRAAS